LELRELLLASFRGPAERIGRWTRAVVPGERIGTRTQVLAKRRVLGQAPVLDLVSDLLVVERHLAVDLLEPTGLVRVSHPARLLVASQVSVGDRQAHEAGVLLEGANREVQHADRKRGREKQLQLADLRMRLPGAAHGPTDEAVSGRAAVVDPDVDGVGLSDPDLGMGAVNDLGRTPEASLPHGQPLRPKLLTRPGDELRARGRDEPEALGDPGDGLLERPGHRPPELVVVVVNDPVGAPLIGPSGERGSPLRPRLARVALDVVELDQAHLAVGLEDLERAVGRPVVADQEEVHPLRAVVTEIRLDQVLGVADEDRHRKAHGPGL
jgi:hypothetical protein